MHSFHVTLANTINSSLIDVSHKYEHERHRSRETNSNPDIQPEVEICT